MAADAARCNPEGRANDRGQLALKQESKKRWQVYMVYMLQ